jgi:hypothetical protein
LGGLRAPAPSPPYPQLNSAPPPPPPAPHFQSCPCPARDVFSRSSDLVASVVVLPLFLADDDGDEEEGGTDGSPDAEVPYGGIYFAVESGCDFENLRDPLLVRGREASRRRGRVLGFADFRAPAPLETWRALAAWALLPPPPGRRAPFLTKR